MASWLVSVAAGALVDGVDGVVGVVGVVGVAMSTAVCSLGSSGWIGLSSPNEVESMCVCVCVELVYRNWKEE